MADTPDKDALVKKGRVRIGLAERGMGALMSVRRRFEKEQPFKGTRVSMNLHVTKETAVLVRAIKAGGADIALSGCNSFSTQDDICAALREEGVHVWAHHGCSRDEYYTYLQKHAEFRPHISVDDGCDLQVVLHKDQAALAGVIGGTEQTTSGVIRLKNMHKDGALAYPIIAINDNKTKHLLDNYYGTGQSTWDGIMRATALFVPGKTVVVVGYGSCGKGVALRAAGLGAKVIVCEVHPFNALTAVYDGYDVMPMNKAAELGDIFVTATGSKHVITTTHIKWMKEGAVLCNVGQFDNEIDVAGLRDLAANIETVRPTCEQVTLPSGKSIFLLGGGNLVNLACAEGHPAEVMATSFVGQALAVEYLKKNKLDPGCVHLPEWLDDQIARLQLEAMNVHIDDVTEEQARYLESWHEGT